MGQNDGYPPKKDPGGVPLLSPGHPCWTAYTTKSIGLNNWKAVCPETGTYSLVGGRWKRATSVPRQRPTQLGLEQISCSPGRRWSGDTAFRGHARVSQNARAAQSPRPSTYRCDPYSGSGTGAQSS